MLHAPSSDEVLSTSPLSNIDPTNRQTLWNSLWKLSLRFFVSIRAASALLMKIWCLLHELRVRQKRRPDLRFRAAMLWHCSRSFEESSLKTETFVRENYWLNGWLNFFDFRLLVFVVKSKWMVTWEFKAKRKSENTAMPFLLIPIWISSVELFCYYDEKCTLYVFLFLLISLLFILFPLLCTLTWNIAHMLYLAFMKPQDKF